MIVIILTGINLALLTVQQMAQFKEQRELEFIATAALVGGNAAIALQSILLGVP